MLKINGIVEETRTVEVDNSISLGSDALGAGTWIRFTTTRDKVGTYSVDVNGVDGQFTVK